MAPNIPATFIGFSFFNPNLSFKQSWWNALAKPWRRARVSTRRSPNTGPKNRRQLPRQRKVPPRMLLNLHPKVMDQWVITHLGSYIPGVHRGGFTVGHEFLGEASACVNNIGMSLEKNFLDCSPDKYPSYGWLSPRISFSCEFLDEEASKVTGAIHLAASENAAVEKPEESNRNVSGKDFVDFEFRLEDLITMLPADKLFFDGKLVPL
ncbi:uncharacterized protein Fot_42750 [Forsythia ovata]|uniref:Uncharacterized protein n=1 Tax=Forsythia ovata TaxID=205694 RepID=A0ABD1RNT7_9LAMI